MVSTCNEKTVYVMRELLGGWVKGAAGCWQQQAVHLKHLVR